MSIRRCQLHNTSDALLLEVQYLQSSVPVRSLLLACCFWLSPVPVLVPVRVPERAIVWWGTDPRAKGMSWEAKELSGAMPHKSPSSHSGSAAPRVSHQSAHTHRIQPQCVRERIHLLPESGVNGTHCNDLHLIITPKPCYLLPQQQDNNNNNNNTPTIHRQYNRNYDSLPRHSACFDTYLSLVICKLRKSTPVKAISWSRVRLVPSP